MSWVRGPVRGVLAVRTSPVTLLFSQTFLSVNRGHASLTGRAPRLHFSMRYRGANCARKPETVRVRDGATSRQVEEAHAIVAAGPFRRPPPRPCFDRGRGQVRVIVGAVSL